MVTLLKPSPAYSFFLGTSAMFSGNLFSDLLLSPICNVDFVKIDDDVDDILENDEDFCSYFGTQTLK